MSEIKPENYSFEDLSAKISVLETELLDVLELVKSAYDAIKQFVVGDSYPHLKEYINTISEALENIIEQAGQEELDEESINVLKFSLTEILDNTDSYLRELSNGENDSEALINQFRDPLVMLTSLVKVSVKEPPIPEIEELPSAEELIKPESEDLQEEKDYLIFECYETLYAINIATVIEIVESKEVSKLPFPRNDILGLINLRSQTLPILDFKSSLRPHNYRSREPYRYIIVLNIHGETFGIQVHNVFEVKRMSNKSFEPIEAAGESKGVKKATLIDKGTLFLVQMDSIVCLPSEQRMSA